MANHPLPAKIESIPKTLKKKDLKEFKNEALGGKITFCF
jgi:hypothetical protein